MKAFVKIALIMTLITSQGYGQAATGYAPVNGLQMYYEIYGQGKPVVLLHGSYMTIGLNWSELIPELSKTHKVIAVEMQGHGRTADIDRPVSYENMADDVAKLLKHLKVDKTHVIGYSLGGTIAFELAIKNPALIDKLVIISSTYRMDGWMPEVRKAFISMEPDFLDNTPLKTNYEKVAPDPKHWHAFLAKFIEFDRKDFNLGDANIKALKSPVLFIMGDNDGLDLVKTAEMYRLAGGNVFADMTGLPKSQLAILPGQTHVSIMMQTEKILSILNPFLEPKENKK